MIFQNYFEGDRYHQSSLDVFGLHRHEKVKQQKNNEKIQGHENFFVITPLSNHFTSGVYIWFETYENILITKQFQKILYK